MIVISWESMKEIIDNGAKFIVIEDVYNNWNVVAENGPAVFLSNVPKTTPRNSEQTDFEDNYQADAALKLETQSNDVLRGGGVQGAITLGTTAVEVKVGASKLANRKSVTVYNNSNRTIYWGYTSAVSVSTGTPVLRNSAWSWDINSGASSTIYIIADDPSLDVRITEGA